MSSNQVPHRPCRKHRGSKRSRARRGIRRTARRGVAMMTALFVMALTAVLVIGILDTEAAHFAALKNTTDYDRARYLAEAGLAHALAQLEHDITWRDGIATTEFPPGSGDTYTASVTDGADAMVIVTAAGTSGNITRRLQATIKHGG